MSLETTLERVINLLTRAEISYMLSGSIASSFYGINRSTQDMDLVIDPTEQQIRRFICSLHEASFYVSDQHGLDAFRRRSQFNVIDMETAWKADLVIRKDRPFSMVEFSRRTKQFLFGIPLYISSVEDTILSKLEWALSSNSERQLSDVKGMFELCAGELDMDYLQKWARELGVDQLLARFRN
ncbi:MAG: hypothetical protein QNK37_19270 [Acidobacteriota bacterium]|nr:hypothetical protein [Acidobacteriota bacterium]